MSVHDRHGVRGCLGKGKGICCQPIKFAIPHNQAKLQCSVPDISRYRTEKVIFMRSWRTNVSQKRPDWGSWTKGLIVYNVPSKGGCFLPEGAKLLTLPLPRYADTTFPFPYSLRQPCVFWDHPGIHVWEEMSLGSNPPSYHYQIKEKNIVNKGMTSAATSCLTSHVVNGLCGQRSCHLP